MKRKILTILLVALMLMGSMPVFASVEVVDTGYYHVKALFPEANILKNMGDPAIKTVRRNGLTEYKYAVMDPNANPVQELERYTQNSVYKLYVYEDGSYVMIGLETEFYTPTEAVVDPQLYTYVYGWIPSDSDATYVYYNNLDVHVVSGLSQFGFKFDVRRDIAYPYDAIITRVFSQYSGGNYVYSGTPKITSSKLQAYQRFLRTDLVENIPVTTTYELRVTVHGAATPTATFNLISTN